MLGGLLVSILVQAALAQVVDASSLPKAALVYTDMEGVPEEKKEEFWTRARKVLSLYYTLVPLELSAPIVEKVFAAGCDGDACLGEVGRAADYAIVLRVRHVFEGYWHQIYLTRVAEESVTRRHATCYLCTPTQFEYELDHLARGIEDKRE
jgi:hypothetical protein